MTLRRYGNPRDANEGEIKKELERLGCLVWRMDYPVDLLVHDLQSGRWTPIEVKMPRANLTATQHDFFSTPGMEGAACVRSPEEARAWVEEIRRTWWTGERLRCSIGGQSR